MFFMDVCGYRILSLMEFHENIFFLAGLNGLPFHFKCTSCVFHTDLIMPACLLWWPLAVEE